MKGPGLVSGALLAAILAAPATRADGPSSPPAAQKTEGKKDKEKKGAKPSPAPTRKVYTEDDLKRYSEDPDGKARFESTSAEGAPSDVDSPSEASQAYGGRQLWASRASEARQAVADAQARVTEIETRITGLRNDMAPGRETEAFRQQALQADIAKAMEDLEAARQDLAKAQKVHEDLLEEARRTGVPAGWVREP